MRQSAWRVKRPTRASAAPHTDDLLETEGDAIPVRIHIVQDGVVTGWDDGALGFDEGAVWFSGRACSFRVFAPDVRPRLSAEGRHLEDSFSLVHPTRDVKVDVTVLDVGDRDLWQDEAFLDRRLVRLRRHRTAEGESEYPPLAPRPGLAQRRPPLFGWWTVALVVAARAWLHVTEAELVAVIASAVLLRWGFQALFANPDGSVLRRIEREERSPLPDGSKPEVPRYRGLAKKIRGRRR